MEWFTELATKHFDFLAKQHGFTCVVITAVRVRYQSDRVFFEITTSLRDNDIDVGYGRFGQPGVLSTDSSEWLSLGIFLGAIRSHLGNYQEESNPDVSSPDYAERKLADLAKGFGDFGRGLILPEPTLYERARELRFWHVGQWTQLWGTSIVMSAGEILRQRQLVRELVSLAQRD